MPTDPTRDGIVRDDDDLATFDPKTFDLRAIVDEAKRAPSLMNAQPARWRLRGDVLELLEAPERRLFASDSSGRAHRIALGAAWEGTRIALYKRGLGLVDEVGAHVADEGVVVRGRLVPLAVALRERAERTDPSGIGAVLDNTDPRGAERSDPLAAFVMKRATWRAKFEPVALTALPARDAAGPTFAAHPTTRFLDDDPHRGSDDDIAARLVRRLARLKTAVTFHKDVVHDAAAIVDAAIIRTLQQPRRLEERLDWQRTRAHPLAERDGILVDALGLSPMRSIAHKTLSRATFGPFARAGIAEAIVSEASPTKSASALGAVFSFSEEPDVIVGARFYRAWLTVTQLGLAACPMSALVDDDDARARAASWFALPEGAHVVSVWRIGRAKTSVLPASARLPTSELIVAP